MYGNFTSLASILEGSPDAVAILRGSRAYPRIRGAVFFYTTRAGVIIATELFGLPRMQNGASSPVFGFHIHGGTACTGNEGDPFADAGSHYKKDESEHPYHAGDMPPVFGNNGYTLSVFLSNRFTVNDVLGKAVVLHDSPDDFHTQPAGNSGNRIACGIIEPHRKQR